MAHLPYTISATFTAGSATVTAATGAFLINVLPGDFVRGPDEKIYFVIAVASNTSLTLDRNYAGTTVTTSVKFAKHSDDWALVSDANVRLARIEESIIRGYTMQSESSLAIGTGTKVFTGVEAGLKILDGIRLRATSRANPENFMEGFCTYSGSTITMTVASGDTGGSGTLNDWNLNLTGGKGTTGAAGPTGLTGLCGFNNKLRNPNFSINQRVRSGTVTLSAGAYGHDGWKAGAGGCTYTFAASGGVVTVTITAGTLVQVCEGGWSIDQSGTYILTWNGTANASLNGGTSGASPRTANLTGGSNATVEFSTGTVILPQLEPGSVASGFERRSQVELALGWRYFQKSMRQSIAPAEGVSYSADAVFGVGGATSTTNLYAPYITFPGGAMRTIPTITYYRTSLGATAGMWQYLGGWSDATATAAVSVTETGFETSMTGTYTIRGAYGVTGAWTASAEL